ncbi:hypothetical protein PsorP6_016514 [Peronosclerospora sorghi]|uniref:Uncharacterized protein n=1 Tax=Peronosclerospora sorghi TaxID=230839 RepID=A0ACC0VRD2_9STRA|nr:hypothetical protein PsorP6_016514 [Peronosclerospora sorghi]
MAGYGIQQVISCFTTVFFHRSLLWKCAYAVKEAVFQECIAELRVLKAEAAEYVMDIEYDQ